MFTGFPFWWINLVRADREGFRLTCPRWMYAAGSGARADGRAFASLNTHSVQPFEHTPAENLAAWMNRLTDYFNREPTPGLDHRGISRLANPASGSVANPFVSRSGSPTENTVDSGACQYLF